MDIIDRAISGLTGSEMHKIRDAIQLLGREKDIRSLDPLNQILSEDNYSEVWADSIEALGEIGDAQSVGTLNEILSEEKYSEVWGESIEALGKIGDTRSLGLIRERLKSGSWKIKWAASAAIGEIIDSSSPDDGLEILLELLENDESIVRFEAATSLSQFNDSKCIEQLILALNDPVHMVRSMAIKSLGEIGDISAIDPILHILHTDDSYVTRRNAAEALGEFEGERVLDDLVSILRDEEFDTTEKLPEEWISDEESFRLSLFKTIARFDNPVGIEYLEELKIGNEEVQWLLSVSEEWVDGNDDAITNGESYVAEGDAAGLVCPDCSGCTMEFDPSMRYPWIDEEDSYNQFKLMTKLDRGSLWHGFNHRTERHCIFFCHSCEKEFTMGEIYDSPFKNSELRHDLPPLYLREKEEVIREIMASESRNSEEYFVKHNAKEIMDYENRTGRNYIKAKQWYDDVDWEVELHSLKIPKFMRIGLSEEVSRRLAYSQFHRKKSSFAVARGDDTEVWINFINLTPRKIALNCEVSEEDAIEIFQILEMERIKNAFSSRYWIISDSNPNHKYEPELFAPSPLKELNPDKLVSLLEYKQFTDRKRHFPSLYRYETGKDEFDPDRNEKNKIISEFWEFDISDTTNNPPNEIKSTHSIDWIWLNQTEKEWNRIRRRKSFPEDARKWYEKHHVP